MIKIFTSKSKLFSVMADLNGRFLYNGKFSNLFSNEVLALKKDGLWTMYIPSNEFKRLNEMGVQIFNDEVCVKEYISECHKIMDCYNELAQNILKMSDDYSVCYRNVVMNYFKIYSLLMAQYRITNLECTSLLKSDGDFVEVLTRIRWDMRKCFMNGNKVFYAFVRKATLMENFDSVIQYMTYDDLLNYRDNYNTLEVRDIMALTCTDNGIKTLSFCDLEGTKIDIDFSKKRYVKGLNVSRITKVRSKTIVLKNANIDGTVKNLLKEDKYIIVTVSLHFDISEYKDNIVGLVCDEGGVLSHSAIIAREYNIPCLTSTKYGTKIFETGDYAELDTSLGIIMHCNQTEEQNMNTGTAINKFKDYLASHDCAEESDIIFRKIDADLNRELRGSNDDYEKILENIFIEELQKENG